jgi:hypothetical protein
MKTVLGIGTAAILATLTASCASGTSGGAPRTALVNGELAELVTFRIVDVMISPTRLDGKPWDVAAQLDEPGARDKVVSAMNHAANAKGAYAAASDTLSRLSDSWGGLPDVGMRASVDPGDGKPQTQSFDGDKDSLTPHFEARWDHIPLSHWTTVHMYFVDQDPTGRTDIGAVVLSPLDLAAALKENGKVHHLRVDDQTNGQILFVGISVAPET